MNSYRQYWTLTVLLMCAVIIAIYQGLVTWVIQKFPDWQIQVAFVGILVIFLWTYGVTGHRAARQLSRNEHALDVLESGIPSINAKSEVKALIADTVQRRERGNGLNQTDFRVLYEWASERLDHILTRDIERIDTVRVLLFFVGLFFTLIGIIAGFATQQFPTNPEEAKVYSFTIIKALGLAYLPAVACIGATLALYVLSTLLHSRSKGVQVRFEDIVYETAILGEAQTRAPAQDARRKTNA